MSSDEMGISNNSSRFMVFSVGGSSFSATSLSLSLLGRPRATNHFRWSTHFVGRSFLYPRYDHRRTENLVSDPLDSSRKPTAPRFSNSYSLLENTWCNQFKVDLQIRHTR